MDMERRYPIGYIRRSSGDVARIGGVSREAQESAVRELARRDGYNGELHILADWNVSADPDKENRRTAFKAMLAAIERGEVAAIYAASLDRLYRSMRTFVSLTDAARAHDVRIVTLREGVLGGDGSPMAQAFAEITAVFSGLELRTAKARAAAGLEVRRERGDHIGMVPYGFRLARTADGQLVRNEKGGNILELDPTRPLAPIIEAVRDGGNILAGCKLLMARGVPPPDGGTLWGSTTLRRIIERNAPELLPKPGPTGRRSPTSAVLAQLLVCHCGHVLTPQGRRKWGGPSYRCTKGNRRGIAEHGTGWIGEKQVLPFVRAAVDGLTMPGDRLRLAKDTAARREAVAARLDRFRTLFLEGDAGVPKAVYDAERERAERDLAALDDATAIVDVPRIDWDWPAADVNRLLRLLIDHVELGEDLRPVAIVWRGRIAEWAA